MLCAYTNAALDHLCLKLLQYSDVRKKLLRLGSSLVVSHKLASYVFDSQACEKATQFDTTSGISKLIADKLIFAVTSTLATKHTLLVSSKLWIVGKHL